MDNRTLLGVAFGAALLCASSLPAGATQIFTSNSTIGATVNGFGGTAGPWTAEIFSSGNECLRLDVTTEVDDLELVAVAPNGNVYRNDDRNGATDRRPLVKVDPSPNNGWYTVSVSQFAGTAVQSNFTLNIQRLPTGNVNCQPATPALGASTKASGGGGLGSAPRGSQPGK